VVELPLFLTGIKADFEIERSDPLQIAQTLDFRFPKRGNMANPRYPAITAAQVNLLLDLGVKDPEKLSKWGAAKLITKLLRRRKEGLAEEHDVKRLIAAGVPPKTARVATADQAQTSLLQLKPRTE